MTRVFLIQDTEDCIGINAFLEGLDRDETDYEVEYDFEEGMPGILVTVEWED